MVNTDTAILDDDQIAELLKLAGNGSLQLPLRIEGWHKSLTDGGHIIRHSTGRTLATIEFVPGEMDSSRPALDGNAPARAIVALLNNIPALCQTVRAAWADAKARNILLLELSGRGELLAKEHVNPDALDGFVAAQNEFDRLRNVVIPELQSRLAQVEKERDDANRRASEAQVSIEGLSKIIFNNQHAKFAISCAATFCRDKAAEWEFRRNGLEPLSKMRNRFDAAFCAANEIREGLERLYMTQLTNEQQKQIEQSATIEIDGVGCECGDLFSEHQKPPAGTPWDICSFPCLKCKCQEFTESNQTVNMVALGRDQDVERWKHELSIAGWHAESATAWRAPDGGLWRGPFGAWRELQRRIKALELDTGEKRERRSGTGGVEGFGDYLPLTAVRGGPGEYEVKARDGRTLWRMEGAALADWVCASVSGYDAAMRSYIIADFTAPTGKVSEEDRELVEAVAMPWICVDDKPCEETVAVHWEEMLTSLTAALATVRKEATDAVWSRAIYIAKAEAFERRLAHNVYDALVEAAANGEAKGRG